MLRLRLSAAFLVCFALVQVGHCAAVRRHSEAASRYSEKKQAQKPATSCGAGAGRSAVQGNGAPQGEAQQPTFRGGIDFVRVDVIVTDKKAQPVIDLKQDDFEVLEDGKPQSDRAVPADQGRRQPEPGDPPPRQIRNRDDEEIEAARDDVRIFVFFFDDYHVRLRQLDVGAANR